MRFTQVNIAYKIVYTLECINVNVLFLKWHEPCVDHNSYIV